MARPGGDDQNARVVRDVISRLEGFEEGGVGGDGGGPGLGGPDAVVALLDGSVGPGVEVAGGFGEAGVGLRMRVGRVEAGLGRLDVEEEEEGGGGGYGGDGDPVEELLHVPLH